MTRTMMTETARFVTGGVDTHSDTHVAAAVDQTGRVLGTSEFAATGVGYRQLWEWLDGYGTVATVGVEGTGSWGSGLARHLASRGVAVHEVIRPNRQSRRRYGKSDKSDAVAAARAVLSGEAANPPRGNTGDVESLRLLRIARRSGVKQRTMTINQIHSVISTAPEPIREQLRGLTINQVVDKAAKFRPGPINSPSAAAKLALKTLAKRHQNLTEESAILTTEVGQLVTKAAPPEMLELCGVGPQTAADLLITLGSNPDRIHSEKSFAALCGTSPVDMSSGKQQRHRLNRGGDRQANSALYRIVIVRLRYHQPTREYVARRSKEGLTKAEIIRCLKRYIARDIWKIYTQQNHDTNPT